MPTFNSNEYLSLPQQVSKNKKDIASLDTRVTNVEADVAGTSSVDVVGPITVTALDTQVILSNPDAGRLAQIIITNYGNTKVQMFGSKIVLPATIVNDAIVFPNVNDVDYDVVFTISAKQLTNPGNQSYFYVAEGDSPDFKFIINFEFRHDTNAFVIMPYITVSRIVTTDNTLVITKTITDPTKGCGIAWETDNLAPEQIIFDFKIESATDLVSPFQLEASGTIMTSENYVYDGIVFGNVSLQGTVVGVDGTKRYTYIKGADNIYNPIKRFTIKARDNRQLEVYDDANINTMSPFTIALFSQINYITSIVNTLATGSPQSTSNFADKRNIPMYPANMDLAMLISGITVNGTSIIGSTSVQTRRVYPDNLVRIGALIKANFTLANSVVFDNANPLVITATNTAQAGNLQDTTVINYGRLYIISQGIVTGCFAKLIRSGTAFTLSPTDNLVSVSLTGGEYCAIRFVSDYA